jgi:hypothetical protein
LGLDGGSNNNWIMTLDPLIMGPMTDPFPLGPTS